MLILFSCAFQMTQAQLTAPSRVKTYEVALKGWEINQDRDPGSDDEATLLVCMLEDQNNDADYLMSWNGNTGLPYDLCYDPDGIDPPINWTPIWYQNVGTISGEKIDFEYQYHEDDTGDRCSSDPGDEARQRSKLLINRTNNFGVWETYQMNPMEFIGNDNTTLVPIEIFVGFRYSKGDHINDALDFGTLTANSGLSHLNGTIQYPGLPLNIPIPDPSLNYTSTVGTALPDVFYQFTVPSEGLQVEIKLNNTTDFNFRLLNNSGALIDNANGQTTMVRTLCGGTYKIEIDGTPGGSEATFTIQLTGDPISFTNEGTLTASFSEICANTAIGPINGDQVFYLPENIQVAGYEWQKRLDGTGDWDVIPGATGQNLTTTSNVVIPESNSFIEIRRSAKQCGTNGKWTLPITITKTASEVEPGTLEFQVGSDPANVQGSPYAIPENLGTSPGTLVSAAPPPSGSPGPITFQWEKFENGMWSAVNCGSNPSACQENLIVPAGLTQDIQYRRRATNACGLGGVTDPFYIEIIPANGVISGHVTSGPNGTGANVQGVMVEAIRNNTGVEGGSLVDSVYTAMTDINGEYTIQGIYFGAVADITVTPSKTDAGGTVHEFNPTSRTVNLSSGQTSATAHFQDLTSFMVEGNVYQLFGSDSCGITDVMIQVDGTSSFAFTDGQGDFMVDIPSGGNFTLIPSYLDHTFDPPSINLSVTQNLSGIEFENTTLRTLMGQYTDGCGNPVGNAVLIIKSTDLCLDTTITINPDGSYQLDLPANTFTVDFEASGPNALEINNYFTIIPEIDLLEFDTVLNFIYRPQLQMAVSGFPEGSCLGGAPLMNQLEPYEITFEVWEGEIGSCPLDTGALVITDQISDRGDTTVPISNGIAVYQILPGDPNIIEAEDFLKTIEYTAFNIDGDELGTNTVQGSNSVIVLGSKARASNFTTVTPQIPMLILRDPPGDASYSSVEIGNSLVVSNKFFARENTAVETWGEVKVGTKFETGIGFITEFEVEATLNSSLTATQEAINTNELVTTISTTETYSTNASGSYIGSKSDVFIGAAINLTYAAADILSFDDANCRIIEDVDLVIAPDSIATKFFFSQNHIENTLIPSLQLIADNTANPDTMQFYLDQIQHWQNMLQYNEDLKENSAIFQSNITFDGLTGPVVSQTSISQQSTESFEFLVEIDASVAAAAGIEVAGAGFSGGVKTSFRTQSGSSTSLTQINTFTTQYSIDDDDAFDAMTVDIYSDPVYKTPIFKLISGQTSCPYEPETSPLDIPDLVVTNPIKTNLDPSQPVSFQFNLYNNSAVNTGVDRLYNFELNTNSFPYDGTFSIAGETSNSITDQAIGFQDPVPITVTLNKGPTTDSYEGVEFTLYPSCYGNSVSAAAAGQLAVASISAYFQTPCSEVSIFEPQDGWTLSTQDNNTLNIHIKDYDKDALEQIVIQYKTALQNVWTNGPVLDGEDLNDNEPGGSNLGTIVPFNVANLDDNLYDIRLSLNCIGGSTFSERVRGLIDREGPMVFGTPKPVDDAYDSPGEEISISFTEPVDCGQISTSMINTLNGNVIPHTISCSGTKILIMPDIDLLSQDPAIYSVTVSGITDLFGNPSEAETWAFSVGDIPQQAQIWYVNHTAPPGGLGNSWEEAFNQLQDAIDAARTDDQIWVAAGTYYPTSEFDLNNSGGSNPRERTFYLNLDVQIYGGFAGYERSLEERDIRNNETILSGDFNQTAQNGDNSLHVVVLNGTYGFGISKNCVLDGLTITKGFANQPAPNNSGGGIYNFGPGEGNKANPTISNCHVVNNYGFLGGGIFNDGSAGGESSPCILSSWIEGNTASTCAGVFNYAFTNGTCEATFINSVFTGNAANFGGGAIQNNSATFGTCNIKILNSTFFQNSASVGAGIYHSGNGLLISNQTTIINSVFWDNFDELVVGQGSIQIDNSLLDDGVIDGIVNLPPNVFGAQNIDADPLFLDEASFNVRLQEISPAINSGTTDTTGLNIPGMDFDGLPRFNGTVDMGAFENPFINCPQTVYISPAYGEVTGNYEAGNEIVLLKNLTIPNGTNVTLNAPFIRITDDLSVNQNIMLMVNPTGCTN